MSKLIGILFLPLISIFTVQNNQIFIKSNLPGEIYAGGTYTVELTIHKKNLKHYATLTQILPEGFTAVEKQSGAANFSFRGRELKFTWLRLPDSSPITLSYDIVADKKMKTGNYNLPTKFVYAYRNLRGTVGLENSKIKVYRKGEVFVSDKNVPKDPKKTQVLRFTPHYSPERHGLVVQLMISRGDVVGKAKITENIPLGYRANAIETKGAHFEVNKNNVEFIWEKLPNSNNFIISYILSPHKENAPLPGITGILRFLQDGKLRDVVTKQVDYKQTQKPKGKKDVNKEELIDYFGY